MSARSPNAEFPLFTLSVKSCAHSSPLATWLTPPGNPPLSWVEAIANSSQSTVPTEASSGGFVQFPHTLLRLLSDVHGLPVFGVDHRGESARPFVLDRGPALRATLVRTGEERHVLLLTAHRIVADRASLTVLEHELASHYAALIEGPAQLPPSYADRTALERQGPDEGLPYWNRWLEAIPPLDLPLDRARPRTPNHRATVRRLLLDAPHAEVLRRLAHEEGVPMWAVPAVAFTVLLARWTGRHDVVFGIPVDRRPSASARTAFGPYEDLLLLGPT